MKFLKLVGLVWTDAFASEHYSGLMIPRIAWMEFLRTEINSLILTNSFRPTIAAITKAAIRHWLDCDDRNGLTRCLQG